MPLGIYNGEGSQQEALPLEGELADRNVMRQDDGTIDWPVTVDPYAHQAMFAAFDAEGTWQQGSEEFEAFSRKLAAFVNDNIKGPFYVFSQPVNEADNTSPHVVRIVLFDQSDIATFSQHYSEGWTFDSEAAAKNAETLAFWQKHGYEFDERLNGYVEVDTPAAAPHADGGMA